MIPSPIQPDLPDAVRENAGLIQVDPIHPLRNGIFTGHSTWGLAGSLAVHVAAVAALGGMVAGWTPGWIPPPAGLSSQAQSGQTFTSVAAAPASDPDDQLLDAPPLPIEVVPPTENPPLSETPTALHAQTTAGRPVDIVLPDSIPAPPAGDEMSVTHHARPMDGASASSPAVSPPQHLEPAALRRVLATNRPVVSTVASSASSIGSRAQAGAQTNAPPRAVYSPEPIYPPQALAAGQQGKAVVRIRVDAAGQVISARVQGTSGNPLLDEAALVAVRRWRFEARSDGGSGFVDFVVPMVFAIEKKPPT